MKRNKHLFILLIIIVLLANLPNLKRGKSGAEYFSLTLAPDDVWNQYFYIRTVFENPDKLNYSEMPDQMEQTFQQTIWGYSIASLALVDSNFTSEAKIQLRKIIKNLEVKKNSTNDESKIQQVRLSLLYNLFELLFQDKDFQQKSRLLITKFSQEINDNEKYDPDAILSPSSTLFSTPELHLSFAIFDKLNLTDFSASSKKWIAALRKITLSDLNEAMIKSLNWNIIFLSAINKPLADTLFQNIASIDELIKKESKINPEIIFAAVAARAVNDTINYAKLIRKIKRSGRPTFQGNYLSYYNLNLTENTLVLFAKVCRFYELLYDLIPRRKTLSTLKS